jgi:hypothetical protein
MRDVPTSRCVVNYILVVVRRMAEMRPLTLCPNDVLFPRAIYYAYIHLAVL